MTAPIEAPPTGDPAGPARAPRGPRLLTAARAALAPLLAGGLTLAGLAAWTATGQAGSPADIRVAEGRVFLPILDTQQTTGAFFDVANTGGSEDRIVAVRSVRGEAMFGDRELTEGAGRMIMVPEIAVPADSTLEMSPFTPNVMLTVDRPLAEGERVDFVLTFQQSGEIPVTAVVTRPSL
ncbi:copper chaperone PCu(A)C [Streptomyces lonarensis]|uniref:Copper chaperone PCu(A)C n=1 Tax=Streptomyces lonarensis TaxID=700599 RepID=A0A7X6CXG1_9ACTN|nr:copper chaperone PCu(A)C [Streptomyces lonarensis]NJQ04193.1 copper chaperone PCu(A)C [Streptomyces lonarensis]